MDKDSKFNLLVKQAQASGWKWNEYYDGGYPYYPLWQHSFVQTLFKNCERRNRYIKVEGKFHEVGVPAWQHHLQQAVISEDPVSYMYEAVFKGKPSYPADDPHPE